MNNKGLTVVEILVSFVIISVIVVGMMNVVYLYRGKIATSNYRKQLITYKNTLTKDIYDDILKMKVYDVERCETNVSRCIKFRFGMNESDLIEKKLEISDATTEEGIKDKYIVYGGQIYKIFEELPNDVSNLKKYESLKFTTNSIILTKDDLGTDIVYHVEIGINHVDIMENFGINLTFLRG